MRVLYITLVLVILDQITKLLIKGINLSFININFSGLHAKRIFGDFLRITFVENEGMAFGFVPFGENSIFYLSIFTFIALIGFFIYFYFHKNASLYLRLPLAIILAGAFGNLLDRIFYAVIFSYGGFFQGKVVDFIDMDFFDLKFLDMSRWPVFNFADIYVTLGVVGLFIGNIIMENKEKKRIALEKQLQESSTLLTETINVDESSEVSDNSLPENAQVINPDENINSDSIEIVKSENIINELENNESSDSEDKNNKII